MRIGIVANTAWYLFNFRIQLMAQLSAMGHTVVAISPEGCRYSNHLQMAGYLVAPVSFSGSGTNPFTEVKTVFQIWRRLRQERIDCVLCYTPKANIYCAIACILTKKRFVVNISGVGRCFRQRSLTSAVMTRLYAYTLPWADWVFFQNREDLSEFVSRDLVSHQNCSRIPGSGVDLKRFSVAGRRCLEDPNDLCFIFVARLLWEKGIGQYVKAAKLVKIMYPGIRFKVLGFCSSDEKEGCTDAQVRLWVSDGSIEYLGSVDDVRPYLADADCLVHPSYYGEGVAKVILEAAAMRLPIITTDLPGCRDAVVDGVSGYLCRPKDVDDLQLKMLLIAEMMPQRRIEMGIAARAIVESQFDEKLVLKEYSDIVTKINAELSVLPEIV